MQTDGDEDSARSQPPVQSPDEFIQQFLRSIQAAPAAAAPRRPLRHLPLIVVNGFIWLFLRRFSRLLIIVAACLIIGFFVVESGPEYELSGPAKLLLAQASPQLEKSYRYSVQHRQYLVNPAGFTPAGKPATPSEQVGQPDGGVYSAKLSTQLANGVTIQNNTTELSLTLAPELPSAAGQRVGSHFVYPGQRGIETVYTAQSTQLAEDVILNHPIGNQLTLSYRLKLPKSLMAFMTPDGNVLVSSKLRALFELTAPVIDQSDGHAGGQPAPASARMTIQGSELHVIASGLEHLTYPIVIDPSILVNSATGFTNGNSETDVTATANQFSESGLTGAQLSAWAATTNLATAVDQAASVAYNGYVYELGGYNSAGSAIASVDYAPLNSNGTIGSWTATATLPAAAYQLAAVVYNGYMYEVTSAGAVNYTQINPSSGALTINGPCGSVWCATTGIYAAPTAPSVFAYNGYIYELDPSSNGVVVAALASNGTVGTWQTSSTWRSPGYYNAGIFAYNGYVYSVGGCVQTSCTTAETAVYYAPIDPSNGLLDVNGSCGSVWCSTTALPQVTGFGTSVVSNGYVYMIGGCNSGCGTTYTSVDVAPMYANGSLGPWQTTSVLGSGTIISSSVAYNGYLYELGGTATYRGTAINNTYYAQIEPAGYTSAFSANTSLPSAQDANGSVVYNGYIYNLAPNTTVDYATISSSGTIGTWAATTSLPNSGSSESFSVVAYEGYLYTFDGPAGTNPATAYSAPINSNGTIGSWTATTAIATYDAVTNSTGDFFATYGLVQAGNYLYVVGGETCGTHTCVPQSTVYYASISNTGTLGAWTSTSALTTANDMAATVASGGYIYEIGGYGTTQTVESAAVNSNGTLGTWTTTTSLPTGTEELSGAVYNGYVYAVGGYTTLGVATVEDAPIGSSGTLGSWTSLPSLTSVTYSGAALAYDGYLLAVGGETTGGTAIATVEDAQINNGGPGTVSSWTTSGNSLPTGTALAATAVYDGYVYEIGGCRVSPDACPSSTVDYAPVNNSGGVGTWQSTTALGTATSQLSAVAYNGYLYELGGCTTGGCTSSTTVDYAAINSNGTIGSWQPTTSLPNAITGAGTVIYNGYIYEVGGCDTSCPASDVDYAPINANGTIGTWTATTSLLTAADWAGVVEYDGYLYSVGGCGSVGACSGSTTNVVQYAPINSNGTVGSWGYAANLPVGTGKVGVAASSGYVYEVAGVTSGGNTATVDYAPINNNGTIGTWTTTTAAPNPTQEFTTAIDDGYVYEIGGVVSGGDVATINYASLNALPRVADYSDLVQLLSPYALAWNTSNTLPSGANDYLGAASANGYLYEIGGLSTTSVYDAPINANGSVTSWTATSSLPSSVYYATSLAADGYLYELGGYNGTNNVTTVDYTSAASNGSLGTWTATAALPTAIDHAASVVNNGYMYEIGGMNNGGSAVTTVDYAQVDSSNGKLDIAGPCSSDWCATGSLSVADDFASAVVYNNYIYLIGGSGTNTVYYAKIDTSNGALDITGPCSSIWCTTTALPNNTASATSVVSNGYIYELGGVTSGETNAVEYAPILANGTLGSWLTATVLPSADAFAAATTYDGTVYELGGYNGTSTLSSVTYGSVVDPDDAPSSIVLNGANSGNSGVGGTANGSYSGLGGITLQYKSATAQCVTLSPTTTVDLGGSELGSAYTLRPTADGCSDSTGLAEYLWLHFSLDDSEGASFPDVNGNHLTITSFRINYHPSDASRLRGGMTLLNGVPSALDGGPTTSQ